MTRKFSSCSTIFIDDSTVSQPNLKNTIRAVALAVYFHIRNRNRAGHLAGLGPGVNGTSVYPGPADDQDDRLQEIFDEKLHPLSVSGSLAATSGSVTLRTDCLYTGLSVRVPVC